MNYSQALDYIHSVGLFGSRPGLSRIKKLCSLLGDPQEKVKYVHIAGTNGKGSVCSMLSEILRASGLKVGLYTSPYILTFNERIKINGEPISENRLADIIERVKAYADAMEDRPTEFELITAAAFLYYSEEKCDIAVLETGLGGRLDATNIITSPIISVITGISLDHTGVLGDTIEQIAAEKGGIIKENRPLVLADCPAAAKAVLEDIAAKCHSPVYKADESSVKDCAFSLDGTSFTVKPYGRVTLSLAGVYQAKNACTAITAAETLKACGVPIGDTDILKGLSLAHWHARFEVIKKDPVVIYDGAHNVEGATALAENIKALCGGRVVLLTGVMSDKDYNAMAALLSPYADSVFTVKPDNPRALDAEVLADVFNRSHAYAKPCRSVSDGVFAAVRAAKEKSLPLMICGSLYMYGEVKNAICKLI